MARLNVVATPTRTTHEGGKAASTIKPLDQLKRLVSTCLLWENSFYETGNEVAENIAQLCQEVPLAEVGALAYEARTALKLRHVPLFLCAQMAKVQSAQPQKGGLVSRTLEQVIQRPDELAEFVALYWHVNGGRKPLSKQVKLGLKRAFPKFSAHALSKWNRDGKVKLRDVLFMVHPKPKDEEQAQTWKQLVEGTLPSADTWEVALSAGQNKKETWERLLREDKLGYMALLMNLRNMTEARVDDKLVTLALLEGAKGSRALPFRFVAAAKHAPGYAQTLSDAMQMAVEGELVGETVVLVDVSGSMDVTISAKSEISRWEAAGALAVMVRQMCQQVRVYTFSQGLAEVANHRGLPLIQAIGASQPHGGTFLADALEVLKKKHPEVHRLVVVTDEQTHDGIVPAWAPHSYLLNVAPYRPGLVTTNGWYRINGWSEHVVRWMQHEETINQGGA